MIDAENIPDYLTEIEKLNPQVIHTNLKVDDKLSTHTYPTSTSYRIDDPNIHQIYDEQDFGKFLLEVGARMKARTPAEVLNRLFPPGKKVCDISEAVRNGVGTCLEKAIIVSLRRTPGQRIAVIKGLLDAEKYGRTFHAFNVLDFQNGIYLADAQNPIISRQGGNRIYNPFLFPLKGYDEKENRFIFEEPYEDNILWKYQLPLNIKTA